MCVFGLCLCCLVCDLICLDCMRLFCFGWSCFVFVFVCAICRALCVYTLFRVVARLFCVLLFRCLHCADVVMGVVVSLVLRCVVFCGACC